MLSCVLGAGVSRGAPSLRPRSIRTEVGGARRRRVADAVARQRLLPLLLQRPAALLVPRGSRSDAGRSPRSPGSRPGSGRRGRCSSCRSLLGYKRILADTYGFTPRARVDPALQRRRRAAAPRDRRAARLGLGARRPPARRRALSRRTLARSQCFAVLAARPWRRLDPRPTRTRWWLRRVLAVSFALLVVASILPVVYGTWRLTIGGVRLVSIARADKPVTLAIFAGLAWMARCPARRRRGAAPFAACLLRARRVRHVGVRARSRSGVLDHHALYQAPYGWLMRLPGFNGLRVPARFWMMTLVCLTALAALAINRLRGDAPGASSPRSPSSASRSTGGRTRSRCSPNRSTGRRPGRGRAPRPADDRRQRRARALSADARERAALQRLQRIRRAAPVRDARAAHRARSTGSSRR